MDSNTHSAQPPEPPQREDLDRLTDTALAQEALALQQAMGRLEGQWLRRLAAVDARGAAGADQDQPAASTASWLCNGLRLGAGRPVRPSRPPGRCSAAPFTQTADALTSGQLSAAHARVLAQGTRPLPDHRTRDAEPVLVEAARRLDPPRLRQAVGYLLQVADPQGADGTANDVMSGEACGCHPPWTAWSPSTGSWRPKPAGPCGPRWNPWPARRRR